MNHAFIILAHKNPSQVFRLVQRLLSPEHFFVIHVDSSEDLTKFSVYFENTTSVYFVKNRCRSSWGTYGIVQGTLNSIDFIKGKLTNICRITLLSGQDYPLQSVNAIDTFFRQNEKKIFINHFPIPRKEWSKGGVDRFPSFEKISSFIKVYGGSQWWSFPMDIINLILEVIEEHPLLVSYFKKVRIPDESFFHTILLNIQDNVIKRNIVNNCLHLMVWVPPYAHPSVYLEDDFEFLNKSRELFARKFDEQIDSKILDKLDSKITGIEQNSVSEMPSLHRQVITFLTKDFTKSSLHKNFKNKPRNYDIYTLFHNVSGKKGSPDIDEKTVIEFDDCILHSLGFTPIAQNIVPGSTHFPLLKFYNLKPTYQYYWLIEDDVYYNGKWDNFFSFFENTDADFISCHIRSQIQDPSWHWWSSLYKISDKEKTSINSKIASFNPIYRISNIALKYLQEQLKAGWVGHHEVLIPTLLYSAGFTLMDLGSDKDFGFLREANVLYTLETKNGKRGSMRYRPTVTKGEITEQLLYHPVKFDIY